MPHVFTFGIPKYFNFTFRAGPQSPSLTDETVDVDSDSKDTTDPEASKVLKTLPISSPEDTYPEARNEVKPPVLRPLFATASSPCGTLSKFPLEIRIMVYKSVLHFKNKIRQAHRFLERYPPIMAKDSTHIEAIDAVLLRTCRTVYQEAVQILYGMNRFYFSKPTELEDFAHMGLGKKPFGCYRTASEPASAVGNSPCGRLTMIRVMILDMSHGSVGDDRKKLWSLWRAFFYPSENQDQLVSFPALEWLALDLTDWALVSEDASKVRVRINSSYLVNQKLFVYFYVRPLSLRLGRRI